MPKNAGSTISSNEQEPIILFVGPIPPPWHGQAVAFLEAYQKIPLGTKYLVNLNFEGKSWIIRKLLTLLAIIKLVRYFSFFKVGLVYFTCSRTSFGSIVDIILINLSHCFGVRLITHLQGADLKPFFNVLPKFYQRIVAYSYRKVDVGIVLLNEMAEQFLTIVPTMRIAVVPNFYDERLDTYHDVMKYKSNHRIQILFLSNIIKSKGIIELISAFKQLKHTSIPLKLVIAGEFVADKYMGEAQIKSSFFQAIADTTNIEYLGTVIGEAKINLLLESDILILPTYYPIEGLPLSIVEAMRAGNAIITTDHNYLKYIIGPQNGLLIKTQSSEAIICALDYLLKNMNQLREIQNYNASLAPEFYSSKKYIKSLTALFEAVI
jgi:glycosyltransferase involved in cell wall biosynthesis